MGERAGLSQREVLVESMARNCARRGYRETTIEDVLRDAHLPREVFDHHFPGKEDCAMAAVEEILTAALGAVSGAYSADASEWESVLQALRALLELFAARPALANFAFVHSRQMMPPAAYSHYESGFVLLNAMLDRLRADQVGEAEPPSCAARAAIGGGEALVRREIAAGRAEQLPSVLPDLVYAGTVAFLGQEEALRLARRGRELLEERR